LPPNKKIFQSSWRETPIDIWKTHEYVILTAETIYIWQALPNGSTESPWQAYTNVIFTVPLACCVCKRIIFYPGSKEAGPFMIGPKDSFETEKNKLLCTE